MGNKEEEESKEGEEKHEIKAEGLGRHKDSLERESMSRLTEERIRESGKAIDSKPGIKGPLNLMTVWVEGAYKVQYQENIGREKPDYKEWMGLRRENLVYFFMNFASQGSENIGWWLQG